MPAMASERPDTYRRWFEVFETALRWEGRHGEPSLHTSADIRNAALAAFETEGDDNAKIDAGLMALNPVWPI